MSKGNQPIIKGNQVIMPHAAKPIVRPTPPPLTAR